MVSGKMNDLSEIGGHICKMDVLLAVLLETLNCFESSETVWVEVIVMTCNVLGTIIILCH